MGMVDIIFAESLKPKKFYSLFQSSEKMIPSNLMDDIEEIKNIRYKGFDATGFYWLETRKHRDILGNCRSISDIVV